MLKPASLREHLTAALPQLRRDPEKLVVFIAGGGLHSTLTQSLSFEYRYTLRLLLLDYAGHADAVMAPLLIWLRTTFLMTACWPWPLIFRCFLRKPRISP